MTKRDVYKLCNQICNFVLINGKFWNTDLKLKDKLKVFDAMNKRLRVLFVNFLIDGKTLFDSYEALVMSEIPDELKQLMTEKEFKELINFSFAYGTDWNPVDLTELREELKRYFGYDIKKTVEETLNQEQHFTFIKGIVHFIYRNTVLEDIHSKSPVLTDDIMKICNIDVMNRFSYVFYELCISQGTLDDFWDVLSTYEEKTLTNPLATNSLLNRFK